MFIGGGLIIRKDFMQSVKEDKLEEMDECNS